MCLRLKNPVPRGTCKKDSAIVAVAHLRDTPPALCNTGHSDNTAVHHQPLSTSMHTFHSAHLRGMFFIMGKTMWVKH